MSGDDAYWSVTFSSRAERELGRLDPPIRSRVIEAIKGLRFEPPIGDIKRLVGVTPPEWRLRVGGWRVRFRQNPATRTIEIGRVQPRGRAYRD